MGTAADDPTDFDLDEAAVDDLDDALCDEDVEHLGAEEFDDEPTRPRIGRARKPRLDTRAEDHELVARMRARDPVAWRIMLNRVDGMLRGLVKRKFANALETVFSSDTIDEIMGDLRLVLMRDDMALLADWDAQGERDAGGEERDAPAYDERDAEGERDAVGEERDAPAYEERDAEGERDAGGLEVD